MAVANTKSTELQNIEASPVVANDVRHTHGRLRIKSATVAVLAADDDTSVYRFFRVKSTDSIKSLRLSHDSITSGSDYDCGLHQTAANGGAVLDADLYADGFTVAVACPSVPHVVATAPYLELRFGDATTSNINDINNQVFDDAGLTQATAADEYDLTFTANTVGSAAGDLTLVMYYTAGD